MNNRKKICFSAFLFCILAGSAFSQNMVSLDTGLKNAVKYFESRLPKGTKLIVMNVSSTSPDLSEYVTEELTACFVNSSAFHVYTRDDLDLIDQEMAYQFSGEVSDETVRSIGKKVGAQTIALGSITLAGDVFRLRIRAIDIESAGIQGIFTVNIVRDRYLTGLLNTTPSPASGSTAPPPKSAPVPDSRPSGGASSGRVRLPDYLLNN